MTPSELLTEAFSRVPETVGRAIDGLSTEQGGDAALVQDLLDRMAAHRADFTLTFRWLCDAALSTQADATVRELFAEPAAFDDWAVRWRHRLTQEATAPQERAALMRGPQIL